jgi:DNA-binding NarL/FixJ family response regulator
MLRADSRFQLVAEIDDVAVAREICAAACPDLLIADVLSPRGDGLSFLQHVARRLPQIRLLVLSHSADPLTLQRLNDIGIHGFVEKGQSLEILEEAMVEVASGREYFTATWSRTHASLREDPASFSKFLSAREQDVLRLVAAGATNKSIAAQLGLRLRSVETYRYRMMRKLGIKTMAGLIEFGLRLRSMPPS